MPFKKTFVVSDETVNSYGFWVRTEGIQLEAAKKNCPAYFNHQTWGIPLGHWENIRLDNGKLLADVVIEGGNDAEKDYIRKIENGDIKGASVGLDILNWNSEPQFLKQGQTAPALWESELFEISLAPLPGNKNALALKSKEGLVTLSDNNKSSLIPDLKQEPDMKQIALKLGLAENATEHEITEAIKVLLSKSANAEAMQKVIEENVANQLEGQHKEFFISLSKTNFAEAMKFLTLNKKADGDEGAEAVAQAGADTSKGANTVKKEVKIVNLIQKGKQAAAATEEGKDTYDYLQKKNPVELARIHKEEPEKYAQLAADYGKGVRYTGK